MFRIFTVKDVAGRLKATSRKPRKCCVLIGAGASLTAGIPLASGFVELIRNRHAGDFERAAQTCATPGLPSYSECMYELVEADRSSLVRDEISKAKVNWAHIALAMMEKANYVDRILTTNFDPLAARACSLLNRFPAIYDLAALRHDDTNRLQFQPSFVDGSAIYHLHGQHTGFVLLNTDEKLEQQANRIKPVLQEAMQGRLIIVCGYSGLNDPLVERIADLGGFPHSLVWVCHNDEDPAENVRKHLLEKFDDCVVVKNKPSDEFFLDLTRELLIEPPDVLFKQFEHYLSILDTIAPYYRPIGYPGDPYSDLLTLARSQLSKAKDNDHLVEIARKFARAEYQEIFDLYGDAIQFSGLAEDGQELVASAIRRLSDSFSKAATEELNENVTSLSPSIQENFKKSYIYYSHVLSLKPDMWEALQNWSATLWHESQHCDPSLMRNKLEESLIKSQNALTKRQDSAVLWFNYGRINGSLSQICSYADREKFYRESIEGYKRCLAIQSDHYESAFNMALVLKDSAAIAPEELREQLYKDAYTAFALSHSLSPKIARPLISWGSALVDEAQNAETKKAVKKFRDAYKKFSDAMLMEPLSEEALLKWSAALIKEAEFRDPNVKLRLCLQALEKIELSLSIGKPTVKKHDVRAFAYIFMSDMANNEIDRDKYLSLAEQSLLIIESACPGFGSYNIATIYAKRNNANKAIKWIKNGREKGYIDSKDEIVNDPDFATLMATNFSNRLDKVFLT